MCACMMYVDVCVYMYEFVCCALSFMLDRYLFLCQIFMYPYTLACMRIWMCVYIFERILCKLETFLAPSCFCMCKLDVLECMVGTYTHTACARPIIILTRSIQQIYDTSNILYIHYLAVALSPALPYARFDT